MIWVKCVQCDKEAVFDAWWQVTGKGTQEARLCEPCMEKLWKEYKTVLGDKGFTLHRING